MHLQGRDAKSWCTQWNRSFPEPIAEARNLTPLELVSRSYSVCDNSDTFGDIDLGHVLAILTHPCAIPAVCVITCIPPEVKGQSNK